ncbi:hypothetical protein Taro_040678, partial [Colocasia esculenta]|nr:hypothetical protein [Colocasia esculenta]
VFRSRQTLFYKLLVLFTAFVPVVLVCSVLGEFPTEPLTSEAHPYPPQVRARRTFHDRRPVQSRVVAVQGRLWFGFPSEASARSREADSDQVRYRFNGLGREISEMVDRRDWGGGGDDLEESTQRMIERIWESLTDIRIRMDQQASVPPVAVPPGDGEAIHVALVPPRMEVRARRTFHDRRPVQSRIVAVQGRYLQLCSSSSSSVV